MIDEIQVKDVALIREASLSPSPRLTVLTGETGAGKTALVSAVKLLVGERADSSCVREGAINTACSLPIPPPKSSSRCARSAPTAAAAPR